MDKLTVISGCLFFLADVFAIASHGGVHLFMGQKKCSKVDSSLVGFYTVIWGYSNKKLNRASENIDFIEFSSLVNFLIGGGFFAMDKCTRKNWKKNAFNKRIRQKYGFLISEAWGIDWRRFRKARNIPSYRKNTAKMKLWSEKPR